MLVAALVGPAATMRWGTGDWVTPGSTRAPELASAVDAAITRGLDPDAFGTGSARFDGEWAFGTAVMAALGNAQLGHRDPVARADARARTIRAVEALLDPSIRSFDTVAWGSDLLDAPIGDDHAVLGYLALALGAERLLDPSGPHHELHDRVIDRLTRRLSSRPGLLATYPGEAYPVDNAAVLGAIGLHARATGAPVPAVAYLRVAELDRYRDDRGLLLQAVAPSSGHAVDGPRGSGTTLAAYFLGFVDPRASRALATAARDELGRSFLGFGGVRERPPGRPGGGDIDSGPVILGIGVSPTGFGIGAARRLGDDTWAAELGATARLFGVPHGGGFLTGGALGDAILLAMLTAEEV